MDINKTEIVKEQYKNSENLDIRISIHQKYSTNKQGFGNWITQQYDVRENYSILELGCGKGDLWNNFELPNNTRLIQTDFSMGMLEVAKKNSKQKNVIFNQIDIQNISYENEKFDMVVANMMLYHVPDLHKGLDEVSRVLKSGCKFYTTTYGENGITEYICCLLKDITSSKETNKAFTLQNGKELLLKHFSDVKLINYEDSLEVTNSEDLVDYIFSMTNFVNIDKSIKQELLNRLEKQKVDGKIIVPKEYGMFICSK